MRFRVLTINQPYASLIAMGRKRIENRGTKISHRGPLLIHAGKSSHKLRLDPRTQIDASGLSLAEMPFGRIVAVANLVEVIEPESYIRDGFSKPVAVWSAADRERFPWLEKHPHAEGPFGWVLEEIHQLLEPIECVGNQGLWWWEGEIGETRPAPYPADKRR